MLSDEEIEKYRGVLLDTARGWIGARDAEDIVQEVLIDFWMSGVCTGRGVLSDLLLLLDSACNVHRRKKKQSGECQYCEDIGVARVSETATMELSAIAQERYETVRLSKRQREIMELHLEGRSNEEIAYTLVISERTVRHHLQRTREILEENRVTLSEFRSAEEMFDWCAEVTVYHAPQTCGSALRD